jgi:hypothetical protein
MMAANAQAKAEARLVLWSAMVEFAEAGGTVTSCKPAEFATDWGKRAGCDPRTRFNWGGCDKRTRGTGLSTPTANLSGWKKY